LLSNGEVIGLSRHILGNLFRISCDNTVEAMSMTYIMTEDVSEESNKRTLKSDDFIAETRIEISLN